MNTSYTFDDSAKSFILESFGKSVSDDDGLIVEAKRHNRPVHTQDGDTITADRFAGIRNGSEIYIRSDILSLVELADILKAK